jgi:hypothetical protein
MNPSFRVFDPPTGKTKVYVVDKGRMWEKRTIVEDLLKERPPSPSATLPKGFNTRSERPASRGESGRISTKSLKESRILARSLLEVSPFWLKSNPFPLQNSASRNLDWGPKGSKSAAGLPAVDPVNLGRESAIRNMEGKEKGFSHKPTVRFSASGVPVLEVS